MPVIGSLRFCDVACRHVDCANIAFSNRSGLNTNPLLDSVGVRPLIDQYVYCLTTTFSFPLPEGDKLAPSTQRVTRSMRKMTRMRKRVTRGCGMRCRKPCQGWSMKSLTTPPRLIAQGLKRRVPLQRHHPKRQCGLRTCFSISVPFYIMCTTPS